MPFRRSPKGSLTEIGEDPDYRFSLANERTFLAWIRTSLALMAGGVAIVQLFPNLGTALARHALGALLIVLGGTLAARSFSHWEAAERAMRLGKSLPHSALPRLLASALAIIAVATLAILLSEWSA